MKSNLQREGNKIGSVRGPFPLSLLNRITFDFIFCMYMDHDHSPLAIESQGNRSLGFRVSNDGVAVEDSFFMVFNSRIGIAFLKQAHCVSL